MPSWLGEWLEGPVAGVVRDFALTDAGHVKDGQIGIIHVEESPDTQGKSSLFSVAFMI